MEGLRAWSSARTDSEMPSSESMKADMAASFRYAVVSALVEKAMLAAKDTHAPALAMAGGVSANRLLRRMMQEAADKAHLPLPGVP